MRRFTTGMIAGTMIGIGAIMMMDPKSRKRTRKMRKDGMKLMNRAGEWMEDMVDLYR